MLHRYWLKFKPFSQPTSISLGCGIAAENIAAALAIFREQILPSEPNCQIDQIIEDVDIRTLDEGHVRPNMEVPVWRGVWFP